MKLDTLSQCLAIVLAIWVLWGCYIILRYPTRFFGPNQKSEAEIKYPDYLAFMGFLMALYAVFYFPSEFLFGLFIPAHWGAVDPETGEWIQRKEGLASLVAFVGLGWTLLKMSKRYYNDKSSP